jgi:L-lactate dehydrogenase complex protein LldG
MAEHGTTRDIVLGRVRNALSRSPRAASSSTAAPHPTPAPATIAPTERVARFAERLASVGGQVHLAEDERAASRQLAAIATACNARSIAVSDDPLVRRLVSAAGLDTLRFDGWSDRERLFEADVGVSGAQAGIAETGTLVLDSQAELHRLVSLVPPIHVAILRAASIVSDLGAALSALDHSGDCGAVTLITGPSRTADIELELVIGVHGPRELHAIVLEDPSP